MAYSGAMRLRVCGYVRCGHEMLLRVQREKEAGLLLTKPKTLLNFAMSHSVKGSK
jgi:hypothetical protein